MSCLNCLSAVSGNSTRWALRKASFSSFMISEWPDMQGSVFGLPALGAKVQTHTSENQSLREPVTPSQLTDCNYSFEGEVLFFSPSSQTAV
jgi:hypothetical protein